MLNLPQIFEDSTIGQQHAIIKQVFKRGLTFKQGSFRTPWINPEFESNLLIIKGKWLLFLEQPSDKICGIPLGGVAGSPLQHLEVILSIIMEVYNKKREISLTDTPNA